MFLNKAVLPARRPGIRDFLGQKKLFIQQPVNGGDMGSLYRFNPGNRSGGNDVMRMNQIILIQPIKPMPFQTHIAQSPESGPKAPIPEAPGQNSPS